MDADLPMKVVIPMAGLGTRMRPLTWSRPKQLLRVANQSMLGHVLKMLDGLPDSETTELIFITGYLGEQMEPYMRRHHPQRKVHYVQQPEMKGQSDAIYRARQLLSGPMLMVYSDTWVQTDLGFLADESAGGVAWTRMVDDPRRFGVAELAADGWVQRLIEKPQSKDNKLVVVGFYFFRDSQGLLAAIEEQFRRDIQLNGEYFLADAVNIMLERGLRMRTEPVGVWLDAGKPETMLEMNRWLLENGRDNRPQAGGSAGVSVAPPVYVHPQARIANSTIGPHAAIGAGCRVENSTVRNAILEDGAVVKDAELSASLIGQRARVHGVRGSIIVGDDATILDDR